MPKLIVVGSGIKSIAHITEETKKIIQSVEKVLYLVNEQHIKEWISREAKQAESLDAIYFSTPKRIDAYTKITDHIINEYSNHATLCVIFYGHPTVFADSALNAVKQIKNAGGNAVILPAISAMDCLFSDLQIDPGDQGCFTIDATELLIYEYQLDPAVHNIVFQAGNLGQHNQEKTIKLDVLRSYLENYYPDDTQLCLYEAAVLPTHKPKINWITINQLTEQQPTFSTTLYLPPLKRKALSNRYLKLLDMNIQDFTAT